MPDIEEAVARLTAAGVRFNQYPGMGQSEHGIWDAPGGARVAWFNDPDGNTFQRQPSLEGMMMVPAGEYSLCMNTAAGGNLCVDAALLVNSGRWAR